MRRPSPRLAASLCALAAAAGLLLTPYAPARAAGGGGGSTTPTLAQIQAALAAATADQDDAAAATTAAAAQLSAVQAQLTAAQQQLAADTAQLATARQAAATAQASAADAETALEVADGREAIAASDVSQARQRLDGYAVSAYETGATPTALILVAAGDGVSDIVTRAGLLDMAAIGQTRQITALKADETALATAQAGVAQAAQAAIGRRQAAQSALDQVSSLVSAAAAQTRQLQSLTAQRTATLAQAQAALAAERARVSELQAESTRVAALIKARASAGTGIVSKGGLIWPAIGPITSGFGYRQDPVTGKYALHAGVDIGVGDGTPIHAAKAGTVIFAGQETGYGSYTCIDHGGGFSTCYAHQSVIQVTVGQVVAQGQVIGLSGHSGYATGPHLHFETRVNGNPVDPMQYYSGPPE